MSDKNIKDWARRFKKESFKKNEAPGPFLERCRWGYGKKRAPYEKYRKMLWRSICPERN